MTNQFGLPVHVFIKPSPWITGCVMVIHCGAMLMPFIADMHWLARYVIVLMTLSSLIQALGTSILQIHPHAPVQLLLTAGGTWLLTCVNGHRQHVQLLPAAFVHPLFTVLVFQGGGRRYRVILTPDIVDADSYRRLRVRLKYMHEREPA